MDNFSDDYEVPEPISVWRENHGNWLLGLVVVICLVGSVVLALGGSTPIAIDQVASSSDTDSMTSIGLDSESQEGPRITIQVKGAPTNDGQIMLAIYDAANQFNDPSQALLKAPRIIEDGKAQWLIAVKKLPARFAVAAFHDQNSDGILNRSVFGIPTEPYGFSNQAKGKFGPPSFEQAVLLRTEKDSTIEVFLGNMFQ